MYEQILDRVDLTRFRPKLAPDVEVKSFPLRWGNDYVMVANPRAMLYYRLEPWEGALLPLMDGTRTVGDIVVERLEEEGELDAAGATQLVQILELGGFLEPVPAGLEKGLERALDRLTPPQRKIRDLPEDPVDRLDGGRSDSFAGGTGPCSGRSSVRWAPWSPCWSPWPV